MWSAGGSLTPGANSGCVLAGMDWTSGMSGGPSVIWTTPPSGVTGWYVVGAVSNSDGGTVPVNRLNRVNSDIFNAL